MSDFLFPDIRLASTDQDGGLDTRQASPFLNRRLYDILRSQIVEGRLPAGHRLPASRRMAARLGVSRNTVLYAYEQLLAEGFVRSRPGSGTYVAGFFPELSDGAAPSGLPQRPRTPVLSQRGRQLLTAAGATDHQWGAFVSGVPDVSLFPHKTWARLLSRLWRHDVTPALMTYASQGGYLPLREALAEHLRIVRAANCDAGQIIITSGIHQGLDLAARILADPGETVWMEDPSYWGVRSVMTAAGLDIVPVPVDEEGLRPPEVAPGAAPRLIFVTPSHQYPLGSVMSMARRQSLLELAQQHDAWVIEDDYDSEFRFDGRPLASLQGLDKHDRVIYLGTFSKTLFPGMRLGYMIVPKSLSEAFARGLSELFREGQMTQQALVAAFMEKGHYASHVRRMRQRYAERRERLRRAIVHHFGQALAMSHEQAGLHMVLHLPDWVDDRALAARAKADNIVARPLSGYYHGAGPPRKGLLLGYACVPGIVIDDAFARLARLIEPELKPS